MPPTPPKPPESHYDLQKLHKFFAFAAFALLVALLGLFAKDYSREWKQYQQQYRELEVEKAKVKYELESQSLAANQDYQKIVKETEAAAAKLKSKAGEIAQLHKHAESLQATINILTKQSQFAKAESDTLKYDFEEARAHNQPRASSMKTRIDALAEKIERLRVQIEEKQAQQDTENNKIKSIEKEAKDLDKQRSKIAKKNELLEKKINRTDFEHMNVANRVAEAVRDLPVIELANSNYRVKQIVLKDITDDVNFMRVPKVDRCITCHLGIDNPDFKDAPQPLRAHPNLELFISKNSPHAMDEFGCTTCHLGRGRATTFIDAVHTPRNEEQRQEWEKKYNWHEDHHWEAPMLPAGLTEASCFKCHTNQEVLKGAEKLNLGLNLIERAGCYNCHTIDKYKNWPKTGPSLEHLASKTTPEWAYRWIDNPQSIRPNTWMPSFFHLSNNNDPQSTARSQQEIHAIVAYLFANSKPFSKDVPDLKGDPVHGEEIVASIGCFACHQIKKDEKRTDRDRDQLRREQGPNLIGLGTKTSQEWLYNWLKNPNRYHPETRMPNLRLSDQEAMDAAAFLSKDKTNLEPPPAKDAALIDQIVYDLIVKNSSVAQTKSELTKMSQDEKLQFAGKRLIRQYGCYSCHTIPGFDNEKPIGVELTEEGNKDIHRLDFGLIDMEHTKEAWFKQKLLDPRIFDRGKLRTPDEKLRMPNFHFTDKEADAVTTALMGFVKDRPAPSKMSPRTPERIFIEEGQKIVRQFNCQGCHIIEGEGGAIQESVTDWLIKYQGKDPADAKALTLSFSPPNLIGEGQKVQAEWLFEFIHQPETIRPWLSVRMPTYHFSAPQLNTLVAYFNYLDNSEFPFAEIYNPHDMKPESIAAGEKLFSKEYFGCASCHIVGDQMPSGSQDSWAPNFAIAQKRLRPEWIVKWLTNPTELLPGTKMPTYFDPKNFDNAGPEDVLNGDEKAQIRALRDYVLTLSSHTPASEEKTPKIPAAVAPAEAKTPAAPAPAEKAPAPVASPAAGQDTSGDDFWADEPAKKK
jgi:mono/diheme cytochrome c family protein